MGRLLALRAWSLVLASGIVVAAAATAIPCAAQTWQLDSLTTIGGNAVSTVTGDPSVVSTPFGDGLHFDGNDGIIVNANPIAGAAQFTMEMIFRPDPITNTINNQPRIFHVEAVPSSPAQQRSIMEGRITETGPNASWYPDIFLLRSNSSAPTSLALIDSSKTNPVGHWYHYAMTYDGTNLKGFIDQELVLSGTITLPAMNDGQVSLGMRHNAVNFFVGAIAKVRFTASALDPGDFLSVVIPGDYDRNFEVDEDDYEFWRQSFGTMVVKAGDGADGNRDGVVDAADYVFWRNEMAAGGGSQAVPLPEPAAWMLLVAGGLVVPQRTRP